MKIYIFAGYTLFGKRWYFHVKGANGEIVAHSEGYRNRKDAKATATNLRDNLGQAEIFCA